MSNNQPEPETHSSFIRSLLREAFSAEIRNLFIIVSGFIGVGTVFYKIVEGWTWVDSFYFTVMTLTTVGYGDHTPTSPLSKIFTTMFILFGLGIMLTFLQTVAREQAKEPFFYRIINRARNQDKD